MVGLLVIGGLFCVNSTSAHADTKVDASASMAIDASTGQVLSSDNANQVLPIASISKLLAVSVILNEIHSGKLNWNTKIKITDEMASISTNTEFSNVTLVAGQSYTVRQLFDAALIKSADGAALALSTINGESVSSFNTKMRKVARQIGITDAKIYNSVGISNSDMGTLKLQNVADNAENEMCARDVAKLARYVINLDSTVLKTTSTRTETFGEGSGATTAMTNVNEMLPGNSKQMTNYVTDGLKTGTSDAAGDCYVGTGKYEGHRIITVVLHANNDRYTQTQNLVNNVIADYTPLTVNDTKTKNLTQVKVDNAQNQKVKLETTKGTTLWVKKGSSLKSWTKKLSFKKSVSNNKQELQAPLKKNQSVGTVELSNKNTQFVDGKKTVKVKLQAGEKVEKASFWTRVKRFFA